MAQVLYLNLLARSYLNRARSARYMADAAHEEHDQRAFGIWTQEAIVLQEMAQQRLNEREAVFPVVPAGGYIRMAARDSAEIIPFPISITRNVNRMRMLSEMLMRCSRECESEGDYFSALHYAHLSHEAIRIASGDSPTGVA